jgi:hypothetical protein
MRPRQIQIDSNLAIALAGQVAAGIMTGDGEDERAYAALLAIGLMVRNAVDDDLTLEHVDEILKLGEHGTVTVSRGPAEGADE